MSTQTTTLAEDAAELRRMKQHASEMYSIAKESKQTATAAELAFLNRMEDEGVDSIKYDGTLFVPSSTTYANVTDRAEFIAWAQENAPEMIEPRERKTGGALNQFVRDCVDNGTPLPPGLDFYEKQYVSQRVG